MEYQKIKYLLDKNNDQSTKSRTRKRIKASDLLNGTFQTCKEIKFYTLVMKVSLSGYGDACILVRETITVSKEWRNQK